MNLNVVVVDINVRLRYYSVLISFHMLKEMKYAKTQTNPFDCFTNTSA